ncbi:MAG: hypothetical protein QOG58_1727 [Caballeronia sp.]|nr:hypothetical protein [Caballeronia sp.]
MGVADTIASNANTMRGSFVLQMTNVGDAPRRLLGDACRELCVVLSLSWDKRSQAIVDPH